MKISEDMGTEGLKKDLALLSGNISGYPFKPCTLPVFCEGPRPCLTYLIEIGQAITPQSINFVTSVRIEESSSTCELLRYLYVK